MIELEVPKDIRKYEAKLFGPFTTRQLICFVAACIIAFVVYKSAILLMPQDICIFFTLIIIAPLLLCGWVKVYGMPFEKFAKVAFTTTFVSPKVRKYVTENAFSDKIQKDAFAVKNKKTIIKNQVKSKNPELVAYK